MTIEDDKFERIESRIYPFGYGKDKPFTTSVYFRLRVNDPLPERQVETKPEDLKKLT